MPRVLVPNVLSTWTGGQRDVEVIGATVRDALAALDRAHPGIATRLFADATTLKPFLRVFVGDRDIGSLAGLETPVGERDEIAIVAAVAGGAGAGGA
jgi:molybdopterin synthase sulfur carrier subunit